MDMTGLSWCKRNCSLIGNNYLLILIPTGWLQRENTTKKLVIIHIKVLKLSLNKRIPFEQNWMFSVCLHYKHKACKHCFRLLKYPRWISNKTSIKVIDQVINILQNQLLVCEHTWKFQVVYPRQSRNWQGRLHSVITSLESVASNMFSLVEMKSDETKRVNLCVLYRVVRQNFSHKFRDENRVIFVCK